MVQVSQSPLVWCLIGVAPLVAWLGASLGLSLNLSSVRDWLVFLLIAPVLEEWLFRSQLQHEVIRRFTGPHTANLLVSFLFMAFHWQGQGMLVFLWLVPSLALGELWRKHGNLLLNVFMHSWFNASLWWVSAQS